MLRVVMGRDIKKIFGKEKKNDELRRGHNFHNHRHFCFSLEDIKNWWRKSAVNIFFNFISFGIMVVSNDAGERKLRII
jgi:hypothetical protein